MKLIKLKSEDCLSDGEALKWKSVRLRYADRSKLVKYELRGESGVVKKPDGSILAVLLKGIIDDNTWEPVYEVLRNVKGDLVNRPDVIGKDARTNEIRGDGFLSPRVSGKNVEHALRDLDVETGKSDMLGYYRYKNPRPGVVKCDLTDWTKHSPYFEAVKPFIKEVDDLYKMKMPKAHARQMAYVKKIPQRWRIEGTAFTTLYVLKNWPTAVHRDLFDIKQGYGVMTTLGYFKGGELCFPQYGVLVDYKPGDLFLGNVHDWHGNFPLLDGERVSCIFFCRKGQHECPA